MNNSHMLSITEQKVCADDRKVWAKDLEKEKKRVTLEALMNWMNVEMTSQMRATAPIRVGSSGKRPVNHFRSDSDKLVWHKCWLSKTSSHRPDQCPKFLSLSIDDRIATAKANHLCQFSWLKRAAENTLWITATAQTTVPKDGEWNALSTTIPSTPTQEQFSEDWRRHYSQPQLSNSSRFNC